MADLFRIKYKDFVSHDSNELGEKEAIVNLDLVDFIDLKTNIMHTEHGKMFELTQETVDKLSSLTIITY